MHILLISANSLAAPYPVYPLGLDYVAGALAGRHSVRILDLNEMLNVDAVAREVKRHTPDLVGVSLRNVDTTDATDPRGFVGIYREVIDAVRTATRAPIVLGGSGFTIFPDEMMRHLRADYGIIGEGERFNLLVDALERGEPVADLPGVVTCGGDAGLPQPWDRPFARAFDSNRPHLRHYLERGGILNLQTQRGCPFRCIYCTYPRIEGGRLRRIPPDDVADTALELQRAGAKYLFVTDSAFNADPGHSAAVARAFINRGVSVPWGAFFAPTAPPKDFFALLARAGLTHVEFGTESMSDAVLASYRKPFRADHVLAAHAAARAAGLYVAHYLLLGGPGETWDTLAETLLNVDKLDRTVLFFFCGIRIYPHTELYNHAVETGQISPSRNLLDPVYYQSEIVSSQEIIQKVTQHARGRTNWIIGAGGDETARAVSSLYARGHTGPLWEYLIQ
jgi:radical SAM superfamily enzyme YgiQ (UPF0313 family)